jgi:hypothetical protein
MNDIKKAQLIKEGHRLLDKLEGQIATIAVKAKKLVKAA